MPDDDYCTGCPSESTIFFLGSGSSVVRYLLLLYCNRVGDGGFSEDFRRSCAVLTRNSTLLDFRTLQKRLLMYRVWVGAPRVSGL